MSAAISVLLIEDDEDDYLITTDVLDEIDRATYNVTWCSDAEDGLEQLRSDDHDVCLLDFRLGARTGLELLEEAGDAVRRTPCILLTGQHDTSVDIAAADAGAADYLVKGQLTSENLERTIRYAIQRREMDAKLEHLAYHDSLTGLPNRALFNDRVSQALARSRRHPGCVTVVVLDLDSFKDVNDSYGHGAGDVLLTKIAQRLRANLRLEDTISRLGGDEFAICIEDRSGHGETFAVEFARRIRDALEEPFDLGPGVSSAVRVSIGIASANDDKCSASDLLRNADVAMYRAKGLGKNTWTLYSDEMGRSLRRRIRLEEDLRTAVRDGGITLAYQAFFDLQTESVRGFEALSRWNHVDLGPQDPGEFISIAEESGVILDLGPKVMAEASVTAVDWFERLEFDGIMSVNVSPRQLGHASFIDNLARCLRTSRIRPERLVLEVTESIMTGDASVTVNNLEKAAEMGVLIALDDFGTGYSSLSHLHLLPVDFLKVDRSFVERIDEESGRSMLAAIAAMADSLNITTIAEGVETEEQRDMLLQLGYRLAQGWLFDKPQPAQAVETLLTAPRSSS